MRSHRIRWTVVFLLAAVYAARVFSDEGLWLFDAPPRKLLKQKYDFTLKDEWLRHLQQAAIRFNNGGSASFVSPHGLVLTNHHVASGILHDLSTPERDLLKLGYYARSPAEELKCPHLELNVLISIEDVSDRVLAAVTEATDHAEAERLRRAVMNTIEKESFEQTGLRSDVVTLYHGGLYHLYRYKKYTDVRLVFAPEEAVAAFGGDVDNFEYPRYALDVAFFRVYEDGRPVESPIYLCCNPTWQPGELVFIAGHPGRTDRLKTVRHLEFMRDRLLPDALNLLRRREVLFSIYAQRSEEHARRASEHLLGIQNSRKARLGQLAGLQDPEMMNLIRAAEARLADAAGSDPQTTLQFHAAQEAINRSLEVWGQLLNEYELLEGGRAFQCAAFSYARTLIRWAAETVKPNPERLREYRDSNLDSVREGLLASTPIYTDVETISLADSLSLLIEQLGYDHPLVRSIMNNKSPQRRAAELIQGTRLMDVAERRRLLDGGPAAIEAADDPMFHLARLVDDAARRVREKFEQQVSEPQQEAYTKLARLRFALEDKDTRYPDATFTLRLSFGTVEGYEQEGRRLPPWTTLEGLFLRAAEQKYREPFTLPESWRKAREALDLSVPLNFVSTADIIGGNSGSPVVNAHGELVGVVFDGNMPSLVWDFFYTSVEGRAIAIHCGAIIETLQKVYHAYALADELLGANKK